MKHELKKIMSRGILMLLAVCIAANGYLYFNRIMGMEGLLLQQYSEYQNLLEILNEDLQADLTAAFPAEEEHQYALYQAITQQEYLQMYPQYIQEMPERAKSAALLSKSGDSGFSQRNIDKTVADFEGLDTLPVRAGLDGAVKNLYQFPLSDIIVLAFILIVCVRLFSREYEQKLYPLILASPSRLKVGAQKIGALFLMVLLINVVIYGGNLLIGGAVLGFGDVSRPIQSIPEFRTCTLVISCLEYIFVGFAIKLFCSFVFGMLVFMLFTLLKKPTLVFLIVVCFLGISFWLYSAIAVTSNVNILHFINAFSIMDSFTIISRYQNINLFGYPVSMTTILPFVLVILFLVSALVILMRFYTSAVCRSIRIPRWIAKIVDKTQRTADKINLHTSIFLHETRKVFSHGRALWILLVLSLLMVSRYDAAFRFKNAEGEIYRQYIEEIGGRITDDTLVFIENEWEHVLNMPSENSSNYMEALSNIEFQVKKARQLEEETGIPAYLVDESGYSKLMLDSGTDAEDTLFIIAAAILCCAGIFSMENTFGTKKLLRICRRGLRLPYDKMGLTLLFSTVAAAIVEITRFAIVTKDYLLLYANEAPVQSLMDMADFPIRITLQQYLILLFVIRLLGAWLVGMLIAVVSSFCRSDAVSIAASFGVIAVPVIAVAAGVQPLQYISVLPFCGGNLLLQDNLFGQIWYGIFLVGCLILGRYLIKKQWCIQMAKRLERKKPIPA